jgi:hypothetical protein
MRLAPFHRVAASLPAALCLFCSSARSEELPAWVEAVKEPVVIKKAAPPSYLEVTQTATITRPKPLVAAEEIEKLNPGVMQVLPGLRDLVGKATVSPKFKTLYDAKIESVKDGNLMSASSFFDCATVLSVKDAKSGRSAVIFQSDMETDTDGSDPVRLSQLSDYDDARLSRTYQPILAYSWSKGDAEAPVNPFLKYHEETLGQLRMLKKQVDGFAQADRGPIWQDVKKYFEDQVTRLDRRATYYREDLRMRRSLVARLDPFIVVPSTWVDEKMRVGDYVAVVHAGRIFPCVIGDTGPTTKAGEASQKLAQALNPKASGRVSAVTSVSVTYIVFPGTRSANGVPDMATYEKDISRLIGEIGGLGSGVKLHSWE